MPAATIEGPTVVASPPAYKTYVARREELWLTVKRDKPIMENGERVDFETGERIGFKDGMLKVPTGKGETFKGARGEKLDGPAMVKFLENHALFGHKEEGFWLLELPAPAPTESEQGELIRLAEEQDVAGIEAFIEAESAGYAREELLKIAGDTLERVKARTEAPPSAEAAVK
jgi:hypothetical protein